MKKWNKYLLLSVTALGFAAAGIGTAISAVLSPDQPEWGCGYGGRGGPGMERNWHNGQLNERTKERFGQRHAALHDKLKLNAEQEAAWQNYTTATMKNLTPPNWNPAEMAKLTAPDRMEKMLERMRERESQMTAQLNALKTFYATLSPEQQKIFNAETGPGQARTRRNNR
jgi:hypothetical protein